MIRLYGSGTGLSEDVLIKHKENNITEIHFRSPIKVIWIDKDVALDIFREKGEWEVAEDLPKLDNTFSIRCSKCGQLMLAHYNDDYPNYCCNCGADMRGEE